MTPADRIAHLKAEGERIAAEIARIEAEERARRPVLAAGQVWRIRSDDGDSWGYWTALPVHGGICLFEVQSACGWAGARGFGGDDDQFEYVGLARDVLRVVPPSAEDPEFVRAPRWVLECIRDNATNPGRTMTQLGLEEHLDACHRLACEALGDKVQPVPPAPQVAPEPTGAELVGRRCWVRDRDESEWRGPFTIQDFDEGRPRKYNTGAVAWRYAKPYVEGVAP